MLQRGIAFQGEISAKKQKEKERKKTVDCNPISSGCSVAEAWKENIQVGSKTVQRVRIDASER